jgi:glycosyltransferase involved in cell wall biosynthesis
MPALTLLHAFPSFEIGGSQMRFAAMANHFGPRYRHLIVAMNGDSQCLARLGAHVPHQSVDLLVAKNRTLGNFLTLRGWLKKLQPDKLITYNWGAIEWALANILPTRPHIHIEDGFGPDEANSDPKRRRALFRRLVLSRASQVVLPSRGLVAMAADQWRLPRRRLCYVPNGIDCARFAVAPDPALLCRVRRRPDELVIGTVASLRPEKNLGRLIEAFALVLTEMPARLVIVGDGPEKDSLERLVAARGLQQQVLFTGTLAHPEQVLGAFDIFALSSDTEQMPFSVLEAMAAGLPIAAVDVGDVSEMVAPENRPQIVPRRADWLAGALITLLRDRAASDEIGRQNQAHVRKHYDQRTMFERYGALFDR